MSKPERLSPLKGHLKPGHHGATLGEPVTLREITRDAVEITMRRGQDSALRTAARTGLGLELPTMGATLGNGRLSAIGIGPGNWMIISGPEAPGSFASRIKGALGLAASVVETGHGQVILELSGAKARQVLAKGCRLDLHPRVFQAGQVARTIIAQIPVVLWQVDTRPTFVLAAPVTFAQSFVHFLLAASAETGCTILPASGAEP
ncbi:MAG: sarcosine oxidase subunit gamma [Bosea sp. (in: a-proteobacteria)]